MMGWLYCFSMFLMHMFLSSLVYLMAEMMNELFIRMLFDYAMNVLLLFW